MMWPTSAMREKVGERKETLKERTCAAGEGDLVDLGVTSDGGSSCKEKKF